MFDSFNFPNHPNADDAPPIPLGQSDYRDRVIPNVWAIHGRGEKESALDCETAVALACFVGPVFEAAEDWSDLVHALETRGFHLVFEADELTLVQEETGVSLCTCASLGYGFSVLKARLGKPKIHPGSQRIVYCRLRAA
ncbi:hypothetical protein [uncultured Tateyamaria sp.]|uniref:hypothetical protein n=1 Tax=uncultured Tateyamaria sp. TaxID=455651 RepID=UPI002633C767|nr:hypothetical protein [uncultured Tateyamaria sp.]